MNELPEAEAVLRDLKDFQRATVDYAHQQLWAPTGSRRFLVADEVGLGKTHVARGVIARTIEHLRACGDDRIDIVYICSNTQIAEQNLRRLNILGGHHVQHADRLTMLPTVLHELDTTPVNFISFTPGTSFNLDRSGGRKEERVLLYRLLELCLGREEINPRKTYWTRFFAGTVETANFRELLKKRARKAVPDQFVERFASALREARTEDAVPLVTAVQECAARFHNLRGKPDQSLSSQRYRLIGSLRALVARIAVTMLRPDLVILDEFQRFKDLLTDDSPAADLARELMGDSGTRVLLLSATPYKMYTLPDEPGGEDHHEDFVATYGVLAGEAKADELRDLLRLQRGALQGVRDEVEGKRATAEIESRLREVMCRTERTVAGALDGGMLVERTFGELRVDAQDLRDWLGIAEVAAALDAPDHFEYWRSAPYLLNLMDKHYRLKQELVTRDNTRDPELASALRKASGLLHHDDIRRYVAIDPGNAKMRALLDDVVGKGAFQLPWIAPSLPYWTLQGPYADPGLAAFTKRLVFSSWSVVPKAISVVLSYEAERRLVGESERDYDHRGQTQLLTFAFDVNNRPTGMPLFGLMYPSPTLAQIGDPVRAAAATGTPLPLERSWLLERVTAEIQARLDRLPRGDGAVVDQRWYWAAPLVLDAEATDQAEFLQTLASGSENPEDWSESMARHLRYARELDPAGLGPMPRDLASVLASLALAGPGTAALRALARTLDELDVEDLDVRRFAWWCSEGFRSLFNKPEVVDMVRRQRTGQPYWRNVLRMCLDGCLSAVLDEYVHMLVESKGLRNVDAHDGAYWIGWEIYYALTTHIVRSSVDTIRAGRRDQVTLDRNTMRGHFAQPFGRQDGNSGSDWETRLRTAFNSPFWPFVLASTSVGQEGLDFHTYSHAVVHWNLPGNPVDLEQREGRVHRFKGHAVRKNVAAAYGQRLTLASRDPWQELFDMAREERDAAADDLVPYWVFPGEAAIERYVPAMPLSREVDKKRRLLRTLGAYRLVLGQPRQEDLLAYFGGEADHSWTRIDLRPSILD
ncbi:Helicase conserved C-terminal domain-containing protein [Saccharopolyspora kobensis]|uniref:Helicase conserved C-terminal domain-containing protein n=1 Tax=Saccharopolyspora kobensis TaxID=146035 RepID=A0A1H5SZI4_9PSEU|nr:helicase-related protein [Saccharopolyspora kobensis]SEF55884.1 Helicase conserved C-terminal domain-containing protein [Saccharopolyspora kobensis]SFC52144.1 Helicase conserved C-terminal domain-containing protein [Saccharopolyspora kobensis]